ncbi:MAG: protein kinase domain-containing protein [Kiritimatiellia bacterium]|jgi:tRNA-specific 2-thiouridylase
MDTPSLPGFEILELVRSGGTTVTWKARQTSLDRLVTLEFLQDSIAGDPAVRANFIAIARALAKVRHPGILEAYDVVDLPGETPYAVMEWADGKTVAEVVDAVHGPLNALSSVQTAIQVAEALEAAWIGQRLLFRNIKPSEIRLTPGQAKITGFSLACQVPEGQDALPASGEVVGTPQFSAPEQLLGQAVDIRADIYALGATLYTMVTGGLPFGTLDPVEILRSLETLRAPHPRTLVPMLPPGVGAVISRFMMRRPEDRPASWRDAIEDLKTVFAGKPLRRRGAPARGPSMVEPSPSARPPASPATSPSPPSDTADGGAPQNTAAAAGKFEDAASEIHRSGGGFFRFLLWILLLVWLVLLGNDRLDNPLGLPFRIFPGASEQADEGEAAASADAASATPRSPAEQAEGTPESPDAPVAQPPDPVAPAPAKTLPPPESSLPDEACRALLDALRDGGVPAALEALPDRKLPAETADALRAALEAIPDVNVLVMDSLLLHRGEEVDIVYMGKTRRIRPIRGIEGELTTEFVEEGQSARAISFRIPHRQAGRRRAAPLAPRGNGRSRPRRGLPPRPPGGRPGKARRPRPRCRPPRARLPLRPPLSPMDTDTRSGKRRVKGLSLFSGGLDSQLAVCVLRDQGIHMEGVVFTSPFFGPEAARKAACALDLPLHEVDFTADILQLVESPAHGFGGAINPCIDCHARMVLRAAELMGRLGFDFLSTGEVVNQRPMSQNRQSLGLVARDSGVGDRLVRPLSAKLLEPTLPEREGLIDREKLLALSGRGRKEQMEIAAAYGLSDYPSPAGGCLLTEKGFARRLRDLQDHEGLDDLRLVHLLRQGRHFRLPAGTQCILGRNRADNQALREAERPGDLRLHPVNVPGPTLLLPRGAATPDDLDLAVALCAAYSDRRTDGAGVLVRIHGPDGGTDRAVQPDPDRSRFQPFLL